MQRVISLFLLLIISRLSFADVIPATVTSTASNSVNVYTLTSGYIPPPACATSCSATDALSFAKAVVSSRPDLGAPLDSFSLPSGFGEYVWVESKTGNQLVKIQFFGRTKPSYSCPSGYLLSDSAGNPDSSGQYCSKSACADAAGTSYSLWVSAINAPTTGCYAGCTVAANVVASFPDSTAVYQLQSYTMKDEVCPASNIDYVDAATAEAANTSAAKAKALEDAKAACGSAGYDIGTANGETVVTCKVPDSPPPSTDTGSSTGTDSVSSGMGTDAGSPETNTSGTQNSTVGGGTGSLGGSGYGQGGTSGGGTDSGGTSGSGTDSGGTSGGGTDSGGTSGSGTDSGGTSGGGTDSGGTSGSGTDSGGTSGSGTDSGGTSGGGTDSGSGSGSGSDSGSGTGTGGETEEESDESGSYPGTDSSFDYADTDRETRTVTDVFKENYEKFKSTELVSSATGFFTVNLSGGACSVIQFDIFGSAVSFDPCAFLEYITSLMRIAVLFACSFFAFRIAME